MATDTAPHALDAVLDTAQALQHLVLASTGLEGGFARVDPIHIQHAALVSSTGTSLVPLDGSARADRDHGPVAVFTPDHTASAHAQLRFAQTKAAWRREARPLARRLHDSVDAWLVSILPRGTGQDGPAHTLVCNATITRTHVAIGLAWKPGEGADPVGRRASNVPMPEAKAALGLATRAVQRLATTPHDPQWPRYVLHVDGLLGMANGFDVQAANPEMAVLMLAARGVNTLLVPGAHAVELTQTLALPGPYDDPHALFGKAFG